MQKENELSILYSGGRVKCWFITVESFSDRLQKKISEELKSKAYSTFWLMQKSLNRLFSLCLYTCSLSVLIFLTTI